LDVSDGAAVPNGRYAGDILHHQPLRHEIFNDAQIFAKKPASWIVQSTLVVVDAIGLAGGPTDQAVEFPFTDRRNVQKRLRAKVMNWIRKKLRLKVRAGERLTREPAYVVARQDVKACLAEPFGKTASSTEEIDDLPTHVARAGTAHFTEFHDKPIRLPLSSFFDVVPYC
jgi:hypothetical protein